MSASSSWPEVSLIPAGVKRSIHEFPKGGSRAPWRLGMSYAQDVVTLRHGRLEDGALRFSSP